MLVKSKGFLRKFIGTSLWIISPFFILLLLTPLTKIPAYYNLCCIGLGIPFSLIIALRVHNDLALIQFQNETVFLSQLNTCLAKLGYDQDKTEEAVIVYRGTPRTGLFAEDIEVTIEQGQAYITAPKVYLAKLVKLLKLTQVEPVPDPWKASPNNLLAKSFPVFHYSADSQTYHSKRSV